MRPARRRPARGSPRTTSSPRSRWRHCGGPRAPPRASGTRAARAGRAPPRASRPSAAASRRAPARSLVHAEVPGQKGRHNATRVPLARAPRSLESREFRFQRSVRGGHTKTVTSSCPPTLPRPPRALGSRVLHHTMKCAAGVRVEGIGPPSACGGVGRPHRRLSPLRPRRCARTAGASPARETALTSTSRRAARPSLARGQHPVPSAEVRSGPRRRAKLRWQAPSLSAAPLADRTPRRKLELKQ